MKTKRSGVNIESKDAKKLKTQKLSQEQESVSKLTQEQVTDMISIETDVLNIEPLQAKYSVVGWNFILMHLMFHGSFSELEISQVFAEILKML
jgi:hypothetical protein